MNASSQNVCIIGAGIVGAASAYLLAKEGWRVTVVDRAEAAGRGTTFANGAQLSYSYVEPLATPDALCSLPKWLLNPKSPLKWRPRLEFAHACWLAQFMACCRPSAVRKTTQALLALSFLARDVLHQWLPALGTPESLCFSQTGKLVIYRNESSRSHVREQLAFQAELGCRQEIVSPDRCREIEPALAATGGGSVAFGVWTASEEAIDAHALACALVHTSGAQCYYKTQINRIETKAGKVTALVAQDHQRIEADHFVVAAGPASRRLLKPLGIDLPIEPIRGLSVTLQVIQENAAPLVSITDTSRKTVHARLGNTLRSAGFAELCGEDLTVREDRIKALCAAVEATFPGACDLSNPRPWAGLRPATPSGRPLVCGTRYGNLWLNTGHGSLGLTLAAGSAHVLHALLSGQKPLINTSPYRLS